MGLLLDELTSFMDEGDQRSWRVSYGFHAPLQAPAVLLLDELTSFLDEGDQRSVLAAVRAAIDAGGVTAVWVSLPAAGSPDLTRSHLLVVLATREVASRR